MHSPLGYLCWNIVLVCLPWFHGTMVVQQSHVYAQRHLHGHYMYIIGEAIIGHVPVWGASLEKTHKCWIFGNDLVQIFPIVFALRFRRSIGLWRHHDKDGGWEKALLFSFSDLWWQGREAFEGWSGHGQAHRYRPQGVPGWSQLVFQLQWGGPHLLAQDPHQLKEQCNTKHLVSECGFWALCGGVNDSDLGLSWKLEEFLLRTWELATMWWGWLNEILLQAKEICLGNLGDCWVRLLFPRGTAQHYNTKHLVSKYGFLEICGGVDSMKSHRQGLIMKARKLLGNLEAC